MSGRSAAVLSLAFAVLSGCATPGAPIEPMPDGTSGPGPRSCVTSFGVIYVPVDELEAYRATPPTIERRAVLDHEREHARRQVEDGGLLWAARYRFSSAFRWAEERAGYAHQLRALREGGAPAPRAWFVESTQHDFYRGMTDRDEAAAWFDSGAWWKP